jgi:hypothetical protein
MKRTLLLFLALASLALGQQKTNVQKTAAGVVSDNLTFSGSLTFPGNLTVGGDINLTEPVGVPAGGLGLTTIANNQILMGNGSGGYDRLNLIGDGVTITKGTVTGGVGNLTLSAASGTGTFPLALYAMIPTADVGSLPADWFVGGLYGTTAWSNGDMTGVKQSLGMVAVPVASPPPGVVLTGQVVTLTSDTADAFFRTTTSGTDPTYDTGTLGNTFTVTTAGTWEAIAGKPGHKPSAVVPFAYTVDAVPTLATAEILASGTTLRTTFSEAVNFGAGGQGGMALTLSSGSVTVGTSTTTMPATVVDWPLTGGPVLQTPVTATLAYTQPGNGIEDSAGQDVISFGPAAVTNSSTYTPPASETNLVATWTSGTAELGIASGEAGYKFTNNTGSSISISQIGFQRTTNSSASTPVLIADSDGTTVLVSATLNATTVAVGQFAWVAISPLTIPNGGVRHIRANLGGYKGGILGNPTAMATGITYGGFSNASGTDSSGFATRITAMFSIVE